MNREGIVIKKNIDDTLEVGLVKHTAWGDCGACQYGVENLETTVTVENEVGASLGDKIEITLGDQNVLGAAFIAYVIPLAVLIASIAITIRISGNEIVAVLIGLALTGLTFFIIKSKDNKFRDSKKYLARAVSIVEKDYYKGSLLKKI